MNLLHLVETISETVIYTKYARINKCESIPFNSPPDPGGLSSSTCSGQLHTNKYYPSRDLKCAWGLRLASMPRLKSASLNKSKTDCWMMEYVSRWYKFRNSHLTCLNSEIQETKLFANCEGGRKKTRNWKRLEKGWNDFFGRTGVSAD